MKLKKPHKENLLFKKIRSVFIIALFQYALLSHSIHAHESKIIPHISAGADRFLEYGLDAQYGLYRAFPAYISGRALRNEVHPFLDNASTLYRFGGGADFRIIGVSAFGQYFKDELYQSRLLSAGGRADLRMVRWNIFSQSEDLLLSDQDRTEIAEERTKEDSTKAMTANKLSVDYTIHQLRLPNALAPKMMFFNLTGAFVWHIRPEWVLVPAYSFFNYMAKPEKDPIQATKAYSSLLLQMAKIGPEGITSRTPGLLTAYQQVYTKIDEVADGLAISAAVTRLQIRPTSQIGWSFWFGLEKYLDQQKSWKLIPAYEHLRHDLKTYSFFSLALQFGWNTPYNI